MSAPYLSQLRSGNRTNPSAATMAALANFFRIKPAYFTDDEYYEKLDKELTWLANMRDEGVRRIAARTVGLSAEAQQDLVAEGRRAASPGAPRRLARGLPQCGARRSNRLTRLASAASAAVRSSVAVLRRDRQDPFAVRVRRRLT